MKRLLTIAAVCALAAAPVFAGDSKPDKDGWISMFNGKNLDGWKANQSPESWKVEDGMLAGSGPVSHLFWMGQECENCEFKATVKIGKGSNSGMYFRAVWEPGWPKGYEAQVNTSHTDPVRTGSLYHFHKNFDSLVGEEEWFTQHIIADGNHIVIKVNGKVISDVVDEKNTHTKGWLALQQHDPKSRVWYKDLMFRPLPAKK